MRSIVCTGSFLRCWVELAYRSLGSWWYSIWALSSGSYGPGENHTPIASIWECMGFGYVLQFSKQVPSYPLQTPLMHGRLHETNQQELIPQAWAQVTSWTDHLLISTCCLEQVFSCVMLTMLISRMTNLPPKVLESMSEKWFGAYKHRPIMGLMTGHDRL